MGASPDLNDARRDRCLYRAAMVESAEKFLRRVTDGDEEAIRTVLAFGPQPAKGAGEIEAQLTPTIRMLVRLAALVALDASTVSLRWAAEQACCTGANNDDIVGVLVAVGADVGLARLVAAAPRLALAIGYDIEVEGWDGC